MASDMMMDEFEGGSTVYVLSLSEKYPEQKEVFDELAELQQKKLWHQLTVKLVEISVQDFFRQNKILLGLHDNFVVKFAKYLNPISYGQFAIAASVEHDDVKESIGFLEGVMKVTADDSQTLILIKAVIAQRQTELGELEEAKKLIAEAKEAIDGYGGIMEPAIHSRFYQASLTYHKAGGTAAEYFRNSLLYLTYTPLEMIPPSEQVILAADLSMAALTGKNIYNFGELLLQPILSTLKGTENEWLFDLLHAFNSGDIAKYKEIALEHKEHSEQKEIVQNRKFLDEKIRLLALVGMVFQRPATERTIGFAEVAKLCDLATDDVEMLLMRSFSLGLLKGSIDQVDANVFIKWVEPRVLGQEQLASLKTRLGHWATKVGGTAVFLQNNAPELVQQTPNLVLLGQ